MLIAIWAQDKNGLIGRKNHLPWHLPNDLRFFKENNDQSHFSHGTENLRRNGRTTTTKSSNDCLNTR